jgi:hypothetical protein
MQSVMVSDDYIFDLRRYRRLLAFVRLHDNPDVCVMADGKLRIASHCTAFAQDSAGWECSAIEYCEPNYAAVRAVLGY